jgi:DNA-binding transcriptional MerR regulator
MSLLEVVERANALLAAATSPQRDGRVRPTLDARTIRYYQTLGIVPPPRRAGGRRAVYRSTHLVRAVMTKLLQSSGMRLGHVSERLATQSDMELWQRVGDLLSGSVEERPPTEAPRPEATSRRAADADPNGPRAITILPGVHLLLEATAPDDPDELLDAMRAWLARGQRR